MFSKVVIPQPFKGSVVWMVHFSSTIILLYAVGCVQIFNFQCEFCKKQSARHIFSVGGLPSYFVEEFSFEKNVYY